MERRDSLGWIADERAAELWASLDSIRDSRRAPDAALAWLREHCGGLSLADLAFVTSRHYTTWGEWSLPRWLVTFLAQLLTRRSCGSLLDPWSSNGLLGALLVETTPSLRADVLLRWSTGNPVKEITEQPHVRLLDPGSLGAECVLAPRYDAIVSLLPIGAKLETWSLGAMPGQTLVRGEVPLLTALSMCDRLAAGGLAVLAVSARFGADASNSSVRSRLSELGLYLTALLRVRSGALGVGVPIDLAVIEPANRGGVYVAAVPEEEDAQGLLAERLMSRVAGEAVAEGRVIGAAGRLPDIEQLIAEDAVRRLAAGRGLKAIPAREAIKGVRRPSRRKGEADRYEEHPDAVYLPMMARTPATTTQADLPTELRSYLQIIVDPAVVRAGYLAQMLNTPIGQAVRRQAMIGATIPRIDVESLLGGVLYLPPLADQDRAVDVQREIRTLRSELDELEARLWDQPRRSGDIAGRVQRVNHVDRFRDWVECLPFPLASILRAYETVDESAKDKYERLLQFFEAHAAFSATVLISGMRRVPGWWEERQSAVRAAFVKEGFSLRRPTFGTWRAIVNAIAPAVREYLNMKGDERAACVEAFCVGTPDALEAIVSRRVLGILGQANGMRNRWPGHGGTPAQSEAEERLHKVRDLLDEFRACVGNRFTQWELICIGRSEVLDGPRFNYSIRRAMGSNPLFEQSRVVLAEAPPTGALCMLSPEGTRALRLMRLFVIGNTPQPACYFYNRLESSTPHYVSYHSPGQSDYAGGVEDLAALETVMRELF